MVWLTVVQSKIDGISLANGKWIIWQAILLITCSVLSAKPSRYLVSALYCNDNIIEKSTLILL